MRLRIGLSTCPNDTFLFAGLLRGAVLPQGLETEFVLADVEELNERLSAGTLEVSKASFATAFDLAERYGVLRVGAALGFGMGPLVLAPPGRPPQDALRPEARVLCPGAGTTASLLLRCFHPEIRQVQHLRFDRILPALLRGEADAGVCIHEARFTWRRLGLLLVEDLGTRWEEATGQPLPLGGILARRDLPMSVVERVTAALAASLAWGRDHASEALEVMRAHAQEFDDEILWRHVESYVNENTADLGTSGSRALAELARRAGSARMPVVFGGEGLRGESLRRTRR